MSDRVCGDCRNFDPVVGPGHRTLPQGRCVARSVYPAKEGPGQVFPANAKRAKEGQRAKISIVRTSTDADDCTFYRR